MLFARPFAAEVAAGRDAPRILDERARRQSRFAETERRIATALAPPVRRSRARRRAAAFGALLVLTLARRLRARRSRGSRRAAAPAPSPARLGAGGGRSGVARAGLPAEAAATAPTDATVYDWNPGAGREEPRVVWIVDRGLDI